MNARVDHLLAELLLLPEQDRFAVVTTLMDSLQGGAETEHARAWQDELAARRQAVQDGSASLSAWGHARARLASA
jgi:putative addiction module component (TIGR02574 family)